MNQTMKKGLYTAGMLSALAGPAQAEMYDGQRAPTRTHADQRIAITPAGTSYKPILKYFGDDLFAAIALPTQNGELTAVGGGLGLLIDDALPQHWTANAQVGFGVSLHDSGVGLEPTVYMTGDYGRVTVDPRVWGSVGVNGNEVAYNGSGVGLTLGVGLADRVRGAVDFVRNPDGTTNTTGTLQTVIEPGRQVLETSIGKGQVGLRYVFHIGNHKPK
ncbi:hypothetical protein HYW21_04810 [Candidatus Woesearchaeota archaeon]|nr:hypothetical protein [Candidatus Woesearchaeota archaeon]